MSNFCVGAMHLFEGYVRNYRSLNLHTDHNRSMFTSKEINYFAELGEMLGYFVFMEDYKPNTSINRSQPMDLSWWKWDSRVNQNEYQHLEMHLERENVWAKDVETIEKLFAQTQEGYTPRLVIGIQNVENASRIETLNELVRTKNKEQQSEALMIYRYYDKEADFDRIWAYHFVDNKIVEERKALCKADHLGYWVMCFEEEYK